MPKEPMECQVHNCHNTAIYRVWQQPELLGLSRRYVCADHLYFAVKDFPLANVTLDADIHKIVDFKAVLAAQGIIVHPTLIERVKAWWNNR